MPKSLRHRLLEKGWTEEEIERTMGMLYDNDKKEKHSSFVSATHPIIYWVGLFIAIIGNLLLSVTLIPFLMILSTTQLYIILGIIGVVFGFMFSMILKDIEHVDQSHHIMAGVFIPAIALITVYIMVNVANRFNEIIKNTNPHSAIVLSIVYLVCFSSPYFVYKLRDFLWERKHKSLPPRTVSS